MTERGSHIRIFLTRLRRNLFHRDSLFSFGILLFPVIATACLHIFAGISHSTFLVIGVICSLVGCFYFSGKEDEYLVALGVGVEILSTIGVLFLLGK